MPDAPDCAKKFLHFLVTGLQNLHSGSINWKKICTTSRGRRVWRCSEHWHLHTPSAVRGWKTTVKIAAPSQRGFILVGLMAWSVVFVICLVDWAIGVCPWFDLEFVFCLWLCFWFQGTTPRWEGTYVMGWMLSWPDLGLGPKACCQRDRERSPTSWRSGKESGWIYWLDVTTSISIWYAFMERRSPIK